MIIPGEAKGVTEFVYIAGDLGVPDSITAILYRWVGSTRSASGASVTVATTANVGEYLFTWTNGAGWSRTDDLELVAIPVIDGVEKPQQIFRTHGDVDAVMRGTNGANTVVPPTVAAFNARTLPSADYGTNEQLANLESARLPRLS